MHNINLFTIHYTESCGSKCEDTAPNHFSIFLLQLRQTFTLASQSPLDEAVTCTAATVNVSGSDGRESERKRFWSQLNNSKKVNGELTGNRGGYRMSLSPTPTYSKPRCRKSATTD